MTVKPIDKARCGRLILAHLDQDLPRAMGIFNEAIQDDRFPELFDATVGLLVGSLRLAIGDDNLRQAASDWVLHAKMQDEQE
ncbi:hypothetical protein [Mycolicibacterium goodii]|uniref:hypothetical protein n=1 Tax=Mycolicibacterium goodii TaxID=134601 RepID=UPI000C262609|nr:hypothetical protein [Mycolicibacterium goodii]PJK21243.1 hypothetical protein CSX11_17000 [Mycolicibacterium goodii]